MIDYETAAMPALRAGVSHGAECDGVPVVLPMRAEAPLLHGSVHQPQKAVSDAAAVWHAGNEGREPVERQCVVP